MGAAFLYFFRSLLCLIIELHSDGVGCGTLKTASMMGFGFRRAGTITRSTFAGTLRADVLALKLIGVGTDEYLQRRGVANNHKTSIMTNFRLSAAVILKDGDC